ncbi:protein RESPONSE TO LOW SULFUR 1-like [Carex rostrata]
MGVEDELNYLRRRNAELEREVCERTEREGALMVDLERTRERLRFTEEAEERLCMQLGELEAEALEQVHMYQRHIKALSDQLELVKKVLVRSDLASINGSSLVLGD